MTPQERAESFLREHAGLFSCASCLAHELQLIGDVGREVLWSLQMRPSFEMRGYATNA
jgi:hypothetical protein